MIIGQFLLCSVVDKWLEKYEHDKRQNFQQGNTSQNLGGGGTFIYSCVARQICFQIKKFDYDLKTNSWGRTWIREYTPYN